MLLNLSQLPPTQQIYELQEFAGSITSVAEILMQIKEDLQVSSFLDIPIKLNSVLKYTGQKN